MLTVFVAATVLVAVFLLHCAVVGGALLGGFGRMGRLTGRAGLNGRGGPGSMGGPSGVGVHGGLGGLSSVARIGAGGQLADAPFAAFYSVCLGMLANMLALFGLGLAGALNLAAVGWAALVLFVLAICGLIAFQRCASGIPCFKWNMRSRAPAADWLQAATLLVIFLLCIAVSLHPPGHWDDTMYQLPLARHYVEQQAIVLHEYVRFPLFPQNMNLLFALGLMLGDADAASAPAALPASSSAAGAIGAWVFGPPEVFAQAFATVPLFIIAVGLWATSRRYLGSGIPGLLAAVTLFVIGPVKSTLGFAYVDNGLALYCWAAALAVAGMVEPRYTGAARIGTPGSSENVHPGEITGLHGNADSQKNMAALALLAGALAGAACGIKYFGLVFATVLGLVVVLIAIAQAAPNPQAAPNRNVTSILRPMLLYALGVVLTGVGWYVRSYFISGDPAHPAGASLFGFFLWNEGDLAHQYAEQAGYGVGINPLKLPAALREAGVLLWLPAVASICFTRVPQPLRVLQVVFVGYLAFWFVVSQVPRYLGPAYGPGSFLAFYTLYRVGQWASARWPLLRALVPAACVLAFAFVYAADRGSKYAAEYLNAERVLARNHGYALYQQANRDRAQRGARLVQVGFEDGVYFFQGTVVGDWFGLGRYRDILGCDALPCPMPDSDALKAALSRHGARMLLLNRQHMKIDEAALQADGWRVLASNNHGVLLSRPPHLPNPHSAPQYR